MIRFEPAIYELLLHESAKYLLHQVKDLKELLTAREQALQVTTAHQQRSNGSPANPAAAVAPAPSSQQPPLSKASSTFAAAASSASMFASRLMNSEPSAEESETQQKRARHLSDLITRALLSEEIDRFRYVHVRSWECGIFCPSNREVPRRKSKFATMNDLMSHFACAEAQLTKRVRLHLH